MDSSKRADAAEGRAASAAAVAVADLIRRRTRKKPSAVGVEALEEVVAVSALAELEVVVAEDWSPHQKPRTTRKVVAVVLVAAWAEEGSELVVAEGLPSHRKLRTTRKKAALVLVAALVLAVRKEVVAE